MQATRQAYEATLDQIGAAVASGSMSIEQGRKEMAAAEASYALSVIEAVLKTTNEA